jgi:hypothetical protein
MAFIAIMAAQRRAVLLQHDEIYAEENMESADESEQSGWN